MVSKWTQVYIRCASMQRSYQTLNIQPTANFYFEIINESDFTLKDELGKTIQNQKPTIIFKIYNMIGENQLEKWNLASERYQESTKLFHIYGVQKGTYTH